MQNSPKIPVIGIIGAGTMGCGIAQVAATAGHRTLVFDSNGNTLDSCRDNTGKSLNRMEEKGRLTATRVKEISGLIQMAGQLGDFAECDLVVEAVVEDPEVKKKLFAELEKIVGKDTVLATNTSSLSVTSIASSCAYPERVIGIHFFNPAQLMPLVEIIPGVATSEDVTDAAMKLIASWGKTVVRAKDTPGFIVNRIARPYYGEAIRIHEEQWNGVPKGAEGFATIDWAMREKGGFKMGPFELMDMIGNDVNYTVTETVWKQFFYDSRYKPSFTQKRLFEAKRFGRKSGQGYYSYTDGVTPPAALKDDKLASAIFLRIISMLINEAAEALYYNVASREDIEIAMTSGVNYPKGLLKWCDEIGAARVLETLDDLRQSYSEERYRPGILLRRHALANTKFFN